MQGWRYISVLSLLMDASLPMHSVQVFSMSRLAFQRAPISLRPSATDRDVEPLMRRRHRTHTGQDGCMTSTQNHLQDLLDPSPSLPKTAGTHT
jgi:hypothetical protein